MSTWTNAEERTFLELRWTVIEVRHREDGLLLSEWSAVLLSPGSVKCCTFPLFPIFPDQISR